MARPNKRQNCTVLVVEDEPVLGMGLTVELEVLGFRIVGRFSTYREVMRSLASGFPDCAVVDVGLKDGSGFEIARKLRCRGVPMVLLSEAEAFRPEALHEWRETPWVGRPVAAAHLAHILDGLARSRGQWPRERAA